AYTLEVTFKPFTYPPKPEPPQIPLPPIPVTATSPTTLTVVVPDTRPILGRLVVGYASFVLKQGTATVFETRNIFILPPMNDVAALTAQGSDVEMLAAMDHSAHLWIPLGFEGFGTGESLPECPTTLTPVTPFAVDFDFNKGDDQAFPYVSFGSLKQQRLFLGDYLLFGKYMYGNKLKTRLDVSPLAQKGVVVCSKNDALQIIMFVALKNPALGKKSSLLPLV